MVAIILPLFYQIQIITLGQNAKTTGTNPRTTMTVKYALPPPETDGTPAFHISTPLDNLQLSC